MPIAWTFRSAGCMAVLGVDLDPVESRLSLHIALLSLATANRP